MADVKGEWFLVGGLVLLPGILAWIGGRRLLAALDDPCLAERSWALRRRLSSTSAITLAVLFLAVSAGLASWITLCWAIPLLVLGRAVGGFPARRRLLGESWSLLAYLRFFTGWWGASLGFWLLLALTPALLAGAPAFALSAAAIGLLLLAWNHWSAAIVRACLGAEPMTDASWHAAFEPIVRAARIGAPRVWRFGPAGSAFANALALPSVTGNGVLLSNALLDRLTREETCAIFAHEVAHLEQFGPGLRRWYAILATTVVGALVVASVGHLRPEAAGLLAAAWPGVVLATLVARVRGRQAHETESDRRAVALYGNAEALVSGLTRIHAIALLPRQWESRFEQSATHPSLARRIQAIRAAAGASSTPPLPSSHPFLTPDGTEAVVLEAAGFSHLAGLGNGTACEHGDLVSAASTIHRFRYADLVELRLAASGTAGPSLCWVERGGKRWRVPVRTADVADLRTALEPAEAQLAPVPRRAGAAGPRARLLGLIGILLAMLPMWHAMLVPAVLALLRPSAGGLAAMAAGLAATAALDLAHPVPYLGSLWWLPLALGGISALVAVRLARDAATEHERLPGWVVAAMALAVVGAWLMWAMAARGSAVRFVLAASESRAAIVLPLAFAAMFIAASLDREGPPRSKRTTAWRIPAAALLAASAAVPLVAATPWFFERFVHDPLLPAAQLLAAEETRRPVAKEMVIEGFGAQLRLAPGGTWAALASHRAGRRSAQPATAFKLADAAGHRATFDAEALEFVSPDTALVIAWRGEQQEIQLRRLDQPDVAPVWARALPVVAEPRLAVDPASGRWEVTGWGSRGGVMKVEGAIGRDEVTESRWAIPDELGDSAPELLAAGERRAWIGHHYASPWSWRFASLLLGASAYWSDATLVFEGGGRASRIVRSTAETQCVAASLSAVAVCAAYDGDATRLTAVEPNGDAVRPIGKVAGRVTLLKQDASGRLLLREVSGEGRTIVVEPGRGRAMQYVLGTGGRYFDAAFSPGFLAVARLLAGNKATRVQVLRSE